MKRLFTFAAAATLCAMAAVAQTTYTFRSTPLAEAIMRIASDHPELNITFIYNELEHYRTSARISTPDPVEALRQAVGRNPVSVRRSDANIWVEARQHGRFVYTGRAIAPDGVPVEAATVMLLSRADSAVLTYGTTDAAGRFSIPCDSRPVIAKITCLGYRPTFHQCDTPQAGTIIMPVAAVKLAQANVEGSAITLATDRTIYRPTQRQKQASQTAIDLLARLSSPQLEVIPRDGIVKAFDGRKASIYIDYQPATDADLRGMNMADVRRVEILDNPSDPRFSANPFVVNFIMQQYVYGGYTKAYLGQSFVYNGTEASLTSRMQYKSMQYDVHATTYHSSSTRDLRDEQETYRLLQPDGEVRTIERNTQQTSGRYVYRTYAAAFKATYRSDRITAASTLTGNITRTPHSDYSAIATYSPAAGIAPSAIERLLNRRSHYVDYKGAYYFGFSDADALNLTPSYTHTRTAQNSVMAEQNSRSYTNTATDLSDNAYVRLNYTHNFTKASTLGAALNANHTSSRTTYGGTADTTDRARLTDLDVGLSYTHNFPKWYVNGSLSWKWTWLGVNDVHEFQQRPTANVYAQYSPSSKHRISLRANYEQMPPGLQHRSDVVVRDSRFYAYTGNPSLRSTGWFDATLSYTFIARKNFSIGAQTAYLRAFKRYAFFYESTPDMIVRTIRQPLGSYWIANAGLNASLSLFDRKLQISGAGFFNHYHSGEPYSFDRESLRGWASAYFYAGRFSFGASVRSSLKEPTGFMTGSWMTVPSSHSLSAGWSNAGLNIEIAIHNFARWNYHGIREHLQSQYFDKSYTSTNSYYHAGGSISLTYTIGYGKKVNRGDDLGAYGNSTNAILN